MIPWFFKVKYWPKSGIWVKLNSMADFGVVRSGESMTADVQQRQNGACDLDLDLENEVKVQRSGNFNWHRRFPLGKLTPENSPIACTFYTTIM